MNNNDDDMPPPPPQRLVRQHARLLDDGDENIQGIQRARFERRDEEFRNQQLTRMANRQQAFDAAMNNVAGQQMGGKRRRRNHSRTRKYSKRGGTVDPMEDAMDVEDVEMEVEEHIPPPPHPPRLVRQNANYLPNNDDMNVILQQPPRLIREGAGEDIEEMRARRDAINIAMGRQMGGKRRTRGRKNRSRRNRKSRTRRYRKSRR
jgi:hypothetical protein